MARRALAALAAVVLLIGRGAAAQRPELVPATELRICADPHNLPFSNDRGEGFENRIAALIGDDLGLPVSYVWFPQVIGFVRNTLLARQCDLVMGTVSGDSIMDTTTPYYHSGYMIVTRNDSPITATSLGDPSLAHARIGLVAATPPTDLVLRHGLMAQVRPYALATDTRSNSPPHDMAEDIVNGVIDVGLLWGPLAGYYIKREHMPLRAAFIEPEPASPRLDWRIAMGVRAGEPDWRRRVNLAVQHKRPEIDRILAEYGVPLLDEQNHPVTP
jgi:quinoprotein dehydrogenase-associated probable ABC transporter substrate-binding protein